VYTRWFGPAVSEWGRGAAWKAWQGKALKPCGSEGTGMICERDREFQRKGAFASTVLGSRQEWASPLTGSPRLTHTGGLICCRGQPLGARVGRHDPEALASKLENGLGQQAVMAAGDTCDRLRSGSGIVAAVIRAGLNSAGRFVGEPFGGRGRPSYRIFVYEAPD